MPLDLPANGRPRESRSEGNALVLNVVRLVNNKLRDVIKIVVACCQTVNSKLIHRSDDQRIIGKEPVPGSHSLSSVQPSFVGRQNEQVQTKDGRCLRPVFC